MGDQVDHPSHYGGADNPYEAIKVIQAWTPEWIERGLDPFSMGNSVKYLCRAGAKGDPVQDLAKAKRYIEFEIQRLEDERLAQRQADVSDRFISAEEEMTGASREALKTTPGIFSSVLVGGEGHNPDVIDIRVRAHRSADPSDVGAHVYQVFNSSKEARS